MPLEGNAGVGTGGQGLPFSVVVGSGGEGLCGGDGGGGDGNFFEFAEDAIVCQGDSVEVLVTVVPGEDFTGTVTLSVSGLPSGVTAAFSTNPVSIVDENAVSTTLTLTAGSSATLGTATITITGTSGGTEATWEFDLIVESCDEVALRFVAEETVNWDLGENRFMFRVQDAGSIDVFRIQSEEDVEGVDQTPTPIVHRLSPNGQVLAVWYELNYFAAGEVKQLVRVYNLGETLTSGGAWGTYDGQPQPDVYVLDAPLLHQVLSADGDNWIDLTVENDGTLYILFGEEVPDEVQTRMLFSKANNNPNFVTGPGRTSFITVIADPRGPDTDSATLTFNKCCQGGAGGVGVEVTANPQEAWWDATPNPASGDCEFAEPGDFCPDPFIEDAHQCFQSGRASVDVTLSIDITGLPNGVYTDDNDDHPGIDIFEYNAADPGDTPLLCGTLTAINGDFTGEIVDGSPRKITLIVQEPVRDLLTLKVKTVAGTLNTQASRELDRELYTTIANGSGIQARTSIFDGPNNLIFTQFSSTGALDATFLDQAVVVDLITGDSIFTVPRLKVLETQGKPGPHNTTGSRYCQPFPGEDGTSGGSDFYASVFVERNGEFYHLFFTNTLTDLAPEYTTFLGSPAQRAPFVVLTGDRTGYMMQGVIFFDKVVRLVTPGAGANEVTAEALPGSLVISPGETEESNPRGLEPYDTFNFPVAGVYRPEIWAMGLVIS